MKWDVHALEDTLEALRRFGGDSTLIECKRAGSGAHDDVYETICSFSNMPSGGVVLLGVDERANFAISGVRQPAKLEQQITNVVRQAITPSPQLEFVPIEIAGKTVLVVVVQALQPSLKPARLKGRAYLRQGDGDYEMNQNDLRMIEVAGLHAREENANDTFVVEGTTVGDLDQQIVQSYVESVRNGHRRLKAVEDDSRLLHMTMVTDGDGQLRLGGLYAMGVFPEAYSPALSATAAVRVAHEVGDVRTRNLADFSGPIPDLLTDSLNWVASNLSKERGYAPNGHMEERLEFPLGAVRELLANAFVHRDLSPLTVDAGKKVEIRITEDRLIIESPGGLKHLTVDELVGPQLTKVPVNPRVYEMVKHITVGNGSPIIEGEGGGIREVFHAMRVAGKPDPRFFDNGVKLSVHLLRASRYSEEEQEWLKGLKVQLSWIQRELLVSLRAGKTWSRTIAVREFSPASRRDILRSIDELVDEGIVQESDSSLVLSAGIRRDDGPEVSSTSTPSNSDLVVRALKGRRLTFAELVESTGLTAGQVRYRLRRLMRSGSVTMDGGRGLPETTYRLA